jgi:hypothetical protein
MNKREPFYALHRYYIWANGMRTHFDYYIKRKNQMDPSIYKIKTNMYMSLWYAALYVVIEGWTTLKLSDPLIDELLKEPYVKLLRKYRNGVCHFQKKYYDERFLEIMGQNKFSAQDSARWVRELNLEFGRYFLSNLKY